MTDRTETLAPEMLRELALALLEIAAEHPTNHELEAALNSTVPQIQAVLRDWLIHRRLGTAHAVQAATFRELHPRVAAIIDAHTQPPRGYSFALADLASPFVQRSRR